MTGGFTAIHRSSRGKTSGRSPETSSARREKPRPPGAKPASGTSIAGRRSIGGGTRADPQRDRGILIEDEIPRVFGVNTAVLPTAIWPKRGN